MTEYQDEEIATLRAELRSLHARQELLADALAAAGEEAEKLQSLQDENDDLRARLRLLGDFAWLAARDGDAT